MKRFLKIACLLIVLLLVGGAVAGYVALSGIAPIGAGYAAKILCSSSYVSGRNYEDIMSEDLEISKKYMISTRLDPERRTAEAKMFGLFKAVAVYRPCLGCTLIRGTDEKALIGQEPECEPVKTEVESNQPWPLGDAPDDDAAAVIDAGQMKKALDLAFAENAGKGLKRTRAVVVVYDGRIVAEGYASGFDENTPLLGWSMTKSVTNALVGILVKQGKLDVHKPAPVAEWGKDGDPRRNITLDQLMRMESGLKFNEAYEDDIKSDCNIMLFDSFSAAAYAAGQPLDHEPGSRWSYSSGTTNIIARIALDAAGDTLEERLSFPRKALFDKIGMNSAILEPDSSGYFVGSSYMYATARDWARFGLLYLNDGVWGDERILPEGWVKYSATPTPHSEKSRAYGAQFWLNTGGDIRWLPFMPEDMFSANGHEGQFVMIIPSRKAVIVRMGLSRGPTQKEILGFAGEVLKALPAIPQVITDSCAHSHTP